MGPLRPRCVRFRALHDGGASARSDGHDGDAGVKRFSPAVSKHRSGINSDGGVFARVATPGTNEMGSIGKSKSNQNPVATPPFPVRSIRTCPSYSREPTRSGGLPGVERGSGVCAQSEGKSRRWVINARRGRPPSAERSNAGLETLPHRSGSRSPSERSSRAIDSWPHCGVPPRGQRIGVWEFGGV